MTTPTDKGPAPREPPPAPPSSSSSSSSSSSTAPPSSPSVRLVVGGTVRWQDVGGSTQIDRLAPKVLRYTNVGRYSTEVSGFALLHTTAVLEEVGTDLCCFYDWWAMTAYSTQARADATAFMLKHRARYRTALFLTSSPIVSMGVNVANVVLGGFLKGTTSRDELDRQLARILGEQQD